MQHTAPYTNFDLSAAILIYIPEMQVLLIRQVLKSKTITLTFIQTQTCSLSILPEPQHSQNRRAQDGNAVAEYVS